LSIDQEKAEGRPTRLGKTVVTLSGKNVVVIGGSRGVGRKIVEMAYAEGANVLAVARDHRALGELATVATGVRTLPLDATAEDAPDTVFGTLRPDVLVVCGGAIPPMAPLQELNWSQFAINWEADVKASFLFCRAALRSLSSGATVILISSGAAMGGSPISGGYAGAKRMQMFMANYCQKESDRLKLGLRFRALAPARIMPETDLGRAAVDGYSRYLGIGASEFIKGMSSRQTPADVARAVVELAANSSARPETMFIVSGKGIEVAS
jgi:NAD(P)-dependent dehydrogenase (short-subunit alcohol dehydrogenase family)